MKNEPLATPKIFKIMNYIKVKNRSRLSEQFQNVKTSFEGMQRQQIRIDFD